jgi:hypothetical protein
MFPVLSSDTEVYSYYIRKQITSIHDALKELSDEQLNFRPGLPEANTAFQIASHVVGNARAWVLGIVCGVDVVRDRPAEFAAKGSQADLAAAVVRINGDIESALATYDGSDLDVRFKPPQVLWGAGEVQEITKRIALADVLEHASIHFGHVQMTRDLAVASARHG